MTGGLRDLDGGHFGLRRSAPVWNATSPMGSRSDSPPAEFVAVRAAARPRALNVWRRWFCVVVSRVVTASHRSLQLFALQTRTVQEPIRPSALTTIHRARPPPELA